jgi:DNA-binding MarR family transcriptional regulator
MAITTLFFQRSRLNVSRSEAGVLRAVADRPQRVTDLAAAEGLTQPAITRLVDRLQDRGWIIRQSDPSDGRVVLVGLTVAGERFLQRLRLEYRAFLHEEVGSLDDGDVEVLTRAVEVLDRLIARLRK